MRALALVPLLLVFAGCSVALHGHQTTGGSTTATTTSAAIRGHASVGSARVSASFGTPAPPGAPGGQISLSRGASVVLILGLLVAETVNYFSAAFADRPQLLPEPQRSIAATCSCYGYKPESDLTSMPASE